MENKEIFFENATIKTGSTLPKSTLVSLRDGLIERKFLLNIGSAFNSQDIRILE